MSQPIKAFVDIAVFVVCVLVFVVLGDRDLTSKFGQNRVRNIQDIVVVVVINGDFAIVDPVQKPILEIW